MVQGSQLSQEVLGQGRKFAVSKQATGNLCEVAAQGNTLTFPEGFNLMLPTKRTKDEKPGVQKPGSHDLWNMASKVFCFLLNLERDEVSSSWWWGNHKSETRDPTNIGNPKTDSSSLNY